MLNTFVLIFVGCMLAIAFAGCVILVSALTGYGFSLGADAFNILNEVQHD